MPRSTLLPKSCSAFHFPVFSSFASLILAEKLRARLGRDETVQRADLAFLDQLANFGFLHFAGRR